jgi:NADH-quinone oxidoreductase subunit H
MKKELARMDNLFFDTYIWPVLLVTMHSTAIILVLLVSLAFFMYADRKIWAAVQMRRGPNVVGPWGLLQSFADILKYVFKEIVIPTTANKTLFLLAPFVTMFLALSAWAVIPVSEGWAVADINVGILYILAISSLGVYGVIMGGWASNSKYPFLSALRAAAQMVSYEVSIGLVIITVLLCVGSLNLTDIVMAQKTVWFAVPLFPMFVVFFISCAMATILFLGGWLPPIDIAPFNWVPGVVWFVLKVCFMFFMFAMTKTIVPRYRYDQLMRLGWKVFLPLSLIWVVLTASVLQIFGLAS